MSLTIVNQLIRANLGMLDEVWSPVSAVDPVSAVGAGSAVGPVISAVFYSISIFY